MPLFPDNGNRDFSFSEMKFTFYNISAKPSQIFEQ